MGIKFPPLGEKRGKKNYFTFKSMDHMLQTKLTIFVTFSPTSRKTQEILKISQFQRKIANNIYCYN